MKLSIITINLNNASGLRKTIESVISQNSRDFEYVIVDGGSIDGSLEVINDFKDYITSWSSEPDNGIYHAMNKGIRMSNGEYLQFLNSGDWLFASDVTTHMLTSLPDCSIIYGNMLKQMGKGKILINREIPGISLLTFYIGTLNHSSAYIRRSLFEKYGLYDESLKIVSDWKFYLVAIGLNNEKVCYRNIDMTCFDMKGISNVNKELDRIERKKVLEELIPANILIDYKRYSKYILQMKRINRFKLTRWLVWFIERVLFKIEKLETRWKREHISY
jgi:glycosyltransferase involved in cell wall biosynthesis